MECDPRKYSYRVYRNKHFEARVGEFPHLIAISETSSLEALEVLIGKVSEELEWWRTNGDPPPELSRPPVCSSPWKQDNGFLSFESLVIHRNENSYRDSHSINMANCNPWYLFRRARGHEGWAEQRAAWLRLQSGE